MRRHGVLNGGGQHLVGRPDDGELTVGVALKAAAISHDTVHRYSLLRLATDPTPAPPRRQVTSATQPKAIDRPPRQRTHPNARALRPGAAGHRARGDSWPDRQ